MLYRTSRLSRLAEQLGWALRQSDPSAAEADCLRNAVNSFFYRDPDTLPSRAPATALSSEPHSFSRVFTAAFFLGLAGMLATKTTRNEAALLQVSQDIGTILVRGIREASVVPLRIAEKILNKLPRPFAVISLTFSDTRSSLKQRPCGTGWGATRLKSNGLHLS